ncbi:MAG: succinate dehydrogenase, cytochrome b556 subunit [Gammaproteobacteria bacterium]|uniref:Succinate dehydrogenase cytochrome b556 subunit n=1 Tax=SAR86 cluster bacterium TaxID=2030880 RepID=A0A368BP79_9GAMM|nr:succinate dehydrogenase, cytochrome b556 subunit [Gammaproteobacteria bacterium]RCL39129.1 MAG: succinate dehydrogenase, cytochrome b556 subunit [SAR86 cluster bacterium]
MSINHNKVRPVYMNLFQIRLPISAISSITHRLAGIYIFFISLPLFLFLLYFTTKSYNDFMFIQQAFNNSIFFSTFVSFSFLVFAYHILTGVRHLLQDLHIGESLSASRVSSYIVFILWFLLTLFVIWMFYL